MNKTRKLLITIVIFSLLFSSMAFASEDVETLSLIGLVEDENSTIEIFDYNLMKYKFDITASENSALSMQKTLEKFDDMYYSPSGLALQGMMYVIEVVPTQVKYGFFALENNKEVTKKTLEVAVRQLITGRISSENNNTLNKEKYEFYKSEYDNAQLSYDLGRISQTQLLEAETKALEGEYNFKASTRNLEDSVYALNNIIGYDLDKEYNIEREVQFNMELKDADFYIQQALENRFEIKNIEEQMLVEVVKRDHYDFRNFLQFLNIREAYDDSGRVVLLLGNELIETKQSITEEIYSAVNDIKSSDLQIAQLEATLEMQQNNYKTMLAQMEQGNLVESAIKELEFAIVNIENNLEVMRYSYNTKRYQLYNATQLGPAYGGGM